MACIRKIGDEYFVEYHAQGLMFQKRAGKSKALAQQLLDDINKSLPDDVKAIYTVRDDAYRDVFRDFLNSARTRFSTKTYQRYRSTLEHFQDFLSEHLTTPKIKGLTPRVIEDYRAYLIKEGCPAKRPLKNKTINFTLYLLSDIFDYAINRGALNDNPTFHIRRMKVDYGSKICVLTEEEVDQLVNVTEGALCDVVSALLKNNKSNTKGIIGYFFEQREGTVLMKDLAQAARQCGLEGKVNFHTLRNTFVDRFLKKGLTLLKIYEILGLTDIARIMRYALLQNRRDEYNP